MNTRKMKTYSELIQLFTFEERFEYLKLNGRVGEDTFGFDRYLNQVLYRSKAWNSIRNQVIVRDAGCDLGIAGREIQKYILIHHMNPLTKSDVLNRNEAIFETEFLICVSRRTHSAIHFGDADLLVKDPVERRPNDTCPWR